MLGKFSKVKDEMGHLVFSLPIPFALVTTEKISATNGLVLVAVSFLIDLDHYLNPLIAKFFKLKGNITIIPSKKAEKGYAIKFLHGIDLYAIYAALVNTIVGNIFYTLGLFLNLSLHHIWDFLVYNHTWREFFFITRVKNGFKPGERNSLRNLIFEAGSVPH